MRFYRRLRPFSAISFDLDDTLYSNRPVMVRAEQAMQQFFTEHVPQTAGLPRKFWLQHRHQVLQQQPALRHDVTALRIASYAAALSDLGLAPKAAQQLAQRAVAHFLQHRSDFTVAASTINLLGELAAHVPLVAITNGNVDVVKIGLAPCFTAVYHPGLGYQSKPFADMFIRACEHLAIAPQQLLHVGDCGHADVLGVLAVGGQAAWLSEHDVGKAVKVLPHVEFSRLSEIKDLL